MSTLPRSLRLLFVWWTKTVVIVSMILELPLQAKTPAPDLWKSASDLLTQNKAKEALQAYERLIRANPDDARGYMGRGRAKWRLNDLDGAIADYDKVIELTPKDSSAFNNRALAYSGKGQRERAILDYTRAIELNPTSSLSYLNRGTVFKALEDYEHAEADLTKVVELDGKNLRAYVNRANVFIASGDLEKAMKDCDKAVAMDAKDPEAWYARASALDALGEDDQALADYDKAIALDPKVAKYHNNRGFMMENNGQHEEAIVSLTNALELAPTAGIHYNNRGNAWMNKGDLDKAMRDFDKAVELAPDNPRAYRNRAGAWLLQDEYSKAIADATKSIELNPQEAKAYRIRSAARDAIGDAKGAAADSERGTILGPQPPQGVPAPVGPEIMARERSAMKAWLLMDSAASREQLAAVRHDHAFAILDHPTKEPTQTWLEEAVAYAKSATALELGNASHWFLTGLLYHELSKNDERALVMAEQAFEKAVDLDPEHAAAWLELGLMMADQERGHDAMVALEKALENDPAATASQAVGVLCATYALNDEGWRGVDFFEEQHAANPEVPALGVGRAIMLSHVGAKAEAIAQAREVMLVTEADVPEHAYAAELVNEWEGKP